MHTVRCKNLILHIADKLPAHLLPLLRRCSPQSLHAFRNLRTADSITFKTGLVDKRTGKISGRTLEHTACTGQLQRLLSDTAVN